ncbi:MAG: hypothetical protein PUC68_03605 [Firmicutes bacterium]|nr:hypothetical protein [Bacillota bacterium]
MKRVILSLIALTVALITLTASTYAWFSLRNSVDTEMLTGKVSSNEIALLISNDGLSYDVECELKPDIIADELLPVSTYDLEKFYKPLSQTEIVETYQVADWENRLIKGSIYLKSDEDCDIYLEEVSVNDSSYGLRLGLKTDNVFIFNLDNKTNPDASLTIVEENMVVKEIANNYPVYIQDPSQKIDNNLLYHLTKDEPLKIDYYIYLEGCDINCVKNIIGSELLLSMSFRGER